MYVCVCEGERGERERANTKLSKQKMSLTFFYFPLRLAVLEIIAS